MSSDISSDGAMSAEIPRFPIRELSARTQVNTVTIRAWERRYGLLTPLRTSKGHRLYEEEDVCRVEQILALVARGVPLRKVKSLLNDDVETAAADLEVWEDQISKLCGYATTFNQLKIEALLSDYLLNYPPFICYEKLLKPAFHRLQKRQEGMAPFYFMESELIRYTLFRLGSYKKQSKGESVILICGDKTPLLRLIVMALELADANYSVQLIHRTLEVLEWLDIAQTIRDRLCVIHQDGVWNDSNGQKVTSALSTTEKLYVCGTAPIVFGLKLNNRVFSDMTSCTHYLLNRKSNP